MIRFLQTPGPFKKYVLGGLLLLMTVSMVWYLVPSGNNYTFGGPAKGVVAKIGDAEVTADEVRTTARQMLQQQMPQGSSANMSMLLPFFSQRAAEQLITRQALISQAKRMGLRVSPEEVMEELQHGRYAATFFPGGNFIGQQEYEDMLQRANLTPTKFENSVADDLLLTKLQALISGSASVSDNEIHDQFVKQNTKVKFDYALLKQDDLKKGLHPTESELKAYYRDHRDAYRVPEQAKVSHILIKTPLPGPDGKVDEKGAAEAQHRAEDLLKQLRNGAKMEDLAKKYSEDPGSAKQGGSLGWIGKGQTVPEFEKVAFSLPKGQISDMVKSSYGFHIIRVDDKKDAHMKSLDEVKSEIEPIVKHQKAHQTAQKKAETLLAQARSQGIDAAAAAQDIPVITSDFFAKRDMLPGLGPSPQFMEAVFAAQEKAPPDMAPTSQGTAVYEVLAIKPPATPTFEEIRSRVEDEFKTEQSRTLLTQKAQELSDRAKAEHDLKKAAKELGATMKTSDLVLPDGQVPDIGSMSGQASVAFTMKPGEISGPVTSGSDAAV